jgi:hypothetical protein
MTIGDDSLRPAAKRHRPRGEGDRKIAWHSKCIALWVAAVDRLHKSHVDRLEMAEDHAERP